MALIIIESQLPAEGKSSTFPILEHHAQREIKRSAFLLRRKGEWLSFLNECPHWSVDLDLGDEEFYDPEIDRIYCKNHGALFLLPNGECETGPCRGRSLIRFDVESVGEGVKVLLSPPYFEVPIDSK